MKVGELESTSLVPSSEDGCFLGSVQHPARRFELGQEVVAVDVREPGGGPGVAHSADGRFVALGFGFSHSVPPIAPCTVLEQHGFGSASVRQGSTSGHWEWVPELGTDAPNGGDPEVDHDLALGSVGQIMDFADIVGLSIVDKATGSPGNAAAVGICSGTGFEGGEFGPGLGGCNEDDAHGNEKVRGCEEAVGSKVGGGKALLELLGHFQGGLPVGAELGVERAEQSQGDLLTLSGVAPSEDPPESAHGFRSSLGPILLRGFLESTERPSHHGAARQPESGGHVV